MGARIPSEKFLQIVKDEGLEAVEQTGFWRVGSAREKAIYIARRQMVSRVDISGFDLDHDGVVKITPQQAKENRMGRIRAQLDFENSDEKTLLSAFKAALKALTSKKVEAAPARTVLDDDGNEVVAKPPTKRKGAEGTTGHAHG